MTGVLRQHWFARRLLLVYEKTIRLALGVFCAATKKPTTNDFNQPHHRTRQCNKEETLDDTTQSETLRISGDASACLDSFALAICKLLRTIFCKGVCQSFVRVWHSQHHNHKFAAVVRARHRTLGLCKRRFEFQAGFVSTKEVAVATYLICLLQI